ncbi:MAG: GlxA family transcriptional regulator [Rhizobiaceae bacterium]
MAEASIFPRNGVVGACGDSGRRSCQERKSVVLLLVPGFPLSDFALCLEAFESANRALGYLAYETRVISADGNPVASSSRVAANADASVATERHRSNLHRASLVILLAGAGSEAYRDKGAFAWLRECRRARVPVAALHGGSFILAAAGLLQHRRCTIHWHHAPLFEDRFDHVELGSDLNVFADGVHTSAGGLASLEFMLTCIDRDFGDRIRDAVCDDLIVENLRDPSQRQRIQTRRERVALCPQVAAAAGYMQENIGNPISLPRLANRVGLSARHLERLFSQELGISPLQYLRRIRLDLARRMIRTTRKPVLNVAISCGFTSNSYFATCYRQAFGVTPSQDRLRARAGIQRARLGGIGAWSEQ